MKIILSSGVARGASCGNYSRMLAFVLFALKNALLSQTTNTEATWKVPFHVKFCKLSLARQE